MTHSNERHPSLVSLIITLHGQVTYRVRARRHQYGIQTSIVTQHQCVNKTIMNQNDLAMLRRRQV